MHRQCRTLTAVYESINVEKIKANDPARDRVIPSKGHAAAATYSVIMDSLVGSIVASIPNLIGVVAGAIIGIGGSLLSQGRSLQSILELEKVRNERLDQGVVRHVNALLYGCVFFADSALQSGAEDSDDVGKWKRAQDRLLERVSHTDVAVALGHSEELLHACYTCDWVLDSIISDLSFNSATIWANVE